MSTDPASLWQAYTYLSNSRLAALKMNPQFGYRRMYETRHTFASWALGAGELPEWVARTLGHVDTSMVYRTYGRYIPNLTRRDGSAFEALYIDSAATKKGTQSVTIWVTIAIFWSPDTV